MFKKSFFIIKYNNGENMKNKRLIKITLILLNLLLICKLFPYLGTILKNCFNLLLPFIIGFTLSFLLLPLVDWLVKHRIKRTYAVLISVSLLFIIIGGIIVFFVLWKISTSRRTFVRLRMLIFHSVSFCYALRLFYLA